MPPSQSAPIAEAPAAAAPNPASQSASDAEVCWGASDDEMGAPSPARKSISISLEAGGSTNPSIVIGAPGGAIDLSQSGIFAAANSPVDGFLAGSGSSKLTGPSWNSPLEGPQPCDFIQSGISLGFAWGAATGMGWLFQPVGGWSGS